MNKFYLKNLMPDIIIKYNKNHQNIIENTFSMHLSRLHTPKLAAPSTAESLEKSLLEQRSLNHNAVVHRPFFPGHGGSEKGLVASGSALVLGQFETGEEAPFPAICSNGSPPTRASLFIPFLSPSLSLRLTPQQPELQRQSRDDFLINSARNAI